MAKLLKGIEAAKSISARLQQETAWLREQGIIPCLAILRVGQREDDLAYERGAMKRCDTVGITVRQVVLPETVTQEELLAAVEEINRDDSIHGCLIFLPLPGHLDEDAVRRALAPAKDVDGITGGSLAAVYGGGGEGYPPCTAQACVELLKHYEVPLQGKRVVVIGRSLVIGKPVSMLLLNENATVTICHSRTENLPAVCREADVLVVAVGRMGLVGAGHVRPGQTVLDVGIHMDGDGNMRGDVRFDEVEPVVEAVTPVPGGVGSVTTAILAAHTVAAARKVLKT